MIKQLPQDERPREKLLIYGPQAVSNADLLAILLRNGTVSDSAMRVAEKILVEFGGLPGMGNISVQELRRIKGVGTVKAVTIAAAIELGKRLSRTCRDQAIIHSPQDAAALLMSRLRFEAKEHFVALLLNTKNHVISIPEISVGTLNASLVHPRELFKEAIFHSAAAIILVHNHPSGDPSPSTEDVDLTKKMVAAGLLLDIAVLDHIIIGDGKYVSLKEQGIIK